MIERLYLRHLVTFDEVELNFEGGLIVFTGPSGAGKSVLLSAILSSFGYTTQSVAELCEVTLKKPVSMTSEEYKIDDECTIKMLKKEKLRYFIDGQKISKKALKDLFSSHVAYLSVRDKSGFESDTLLSYIDRSLFRDDKNFKKRIKNYQKRFRHYQEKSQALSKIRADEAKLAELIEYANYEIEKIEKINPKIGEYERLLAVKKELSRVDKIKKTLTEASSLFVAESSILELYELLDKDASIFSDMMNQLRTDLEEAQEFVSELEETDIEEVLDRLSDIASLQQRYGSIEEALDYKEQKKKELLGYQNIEQDKSTLEQFLQMESIELSTLAREITLKRKEQALKLTKEIEKYLTTLKLPSLEFIFSSKRLDDNGADSIEIQLNGSTAETLSGGEFNRLRLALMASVIDESPQGIIILDEIDANVSGDESIAIAQMIKRLSLVYQIFAISHQPHLSAQANQHFVVTKDNNRSEVIALSEEGRISEISRIIAGENPHSEAIEFAKKLRS